MAKYYETKTVFNFKWDQVVIEYTNLRETLLFYHV